MPAPDWKPDALPYTSIVSPDGHMRPESTAGPAALNGPNVGPSDGIAVGTSNCTAAGGVAWTIPVGTAKANVAVAATRIEIFRIGTSFAPADL